MSSVLEDVQRQLVTTFAGAAGVPVYDGYDLTGDDPVTLVLVGDDGDPESDTASSFTQEPANISGSSRYENGSIPCAVLASLGDTDPATVRAGAFAALAACEAAVRTDPTLGGLVLISQIAAGSTVQVQDASGSAVAVQFELTYFAQV